MLNPKLVTNSFANSILTLDRHTISSEFIGYDFYGKAQYNTTRTDLGQLMYEFKYRGNMSAADKIIELIKPELERYKNLNIDFVLPVPPTEKSRSYQPVYVLAQKIADYLGVRNTTEYWEKESNVCAKNGGNTQGTIKRLHSFRRPVNVLIVDDIMKTGGTFNECVRCLEEDEKVKDIHCLAMTRTGG